MKRHCLCSYIRMQGTKQSVCCTYHFTSVDKAQDANYNLQKDEDDQSNRILVVYYGGWGEL